MSSSEHGISTLGIAVTDISPDGIWVLASGEELFLPFDTFPWFKKGTVDQILNVTEEQPGQYHWPDLDIDLGLDSIRNPEKFPLRAKS
jgi:uncharacterized protein DUF2442